MFVCGAGNADVAESNAGAVPQGGLFTLGHQTSRSESPDDWCPGGIHTKANLNLTFCGKI